MIKINETLTPIYLDIISKHFNDINFKIEDNQMIINEDDLIHISYNRPKFIKDYDEKFIEETFDNFENYEDLD